jgi:ABC-type uncharacterized transport system permease subunit
MDNKNWFYLIVGVFFASSLSGLAALLRSRQKITKRAVTSSLLNSGFCGLACALLMIHKLGAESVPLVVAISILAGLGGTSVIDFLGELFKAYMQSRFSK